MKFFERLVLVLLAVIGAIALHQIVAKYLGIHHWDGMKSADWAAWVQAIGSIAAIMGAFQLAERSNREAKQSARIDEIEEENRKLELLMALGSQDLALCKQFQTCIDACTFGELCDIRPRFIAELRRAHTTIGTFDIPTGQIAVRLFGLIQILQEMEVMLVEHYPEKPRYFAGDRNFDPDMLGNELIAAGLEEAVDVLRKSAREFGEVCNNRMQMNQRILAQRHS